MSTIAALSVLKTESGRGRNALGILLEASPFLRFLEKVGGWQEDASTFTYEAGEETSTAPARALNATYTPADRARAALLSGGLRNHGDAVSTDVSLLADAARGLRNADKWLENAIATKIAAFARKYEYLLFKSPGTSSSIIGLQTILDGTTDIPGFTSFTGVANAKDATAASDVSLDVSDAAGQKALIEFLRLQLAEVENPLGIVMSPALWARLNTAATDLKMVTHGGIDQFGQPVMAFDNVEIVKTLPDTLPTTEADDTPTTPLTNTTSIYIMSPGEDRFSLRSNSGLYYIDHDHVENTEFGQEWWEIRAALTITNKRAVRRIRNIKL